MVLFSLPDGPHPLPIKQRQVLVNVGDAILQNIRRGKKYSLATAKNSAVLVGA